MNTHNLITGGGGRPKGALAARPTEKQVHSYRRDLHAQARAGDTLALIGVVLIDTLERQHQTKGKSCTP